MNTQQVSHEGTSGPRLLGWLCLLVLPAGVWSVYVYASRMMRRFTESTDYAMLVLALAIGVAGILLLVRSRQSRLLAAAIYLPVTGLAMYFGMRATAW